MDSLAVTVPLPRSVMPAAGVEERELPALIREYFAVELYRLGRVSLGKAAELAGVTTKTEMMAALARHGVWLNYTAEDAAEDLETLRTLLAG